MEWGIPKISACHKISTRAPPWVGTYSKNALLHRHYPIKKHNLGGRGKWKLDKSCFYFVGREAYWGSYVGGVPHAPKILVVGQSSGSYKRRKKKLWLHPTLINRNMKISRRSGIWERVWFQLFKAVDGMFDSQRCFLRVWKTQSNFDSYSLISHIFCARFYSCTPYKQPKGREYNVISLLELYYLDCFFLMMGQSKNK